MGPDDRDCVTTGELVDLFCRAWGDGQSWENHFAGGPHEANFLKLDCSRIKKVFGWKPVWDVKTAVEKTVEWSRAWLDGENINRFMDKQIQEFMMEM